MKKIRFRETSSFVSMLSNLAIVFLCFTVCRVAFLWVNYSFFADDLSAGLVASMFQGGLRFDLTALLYTNALYILLMALPFPFKEGRAYQRVAKWLFVLTNSVALASNLMDAVYFQYTNRRTTATVFREFANEGNLLSIIGKEAVSHWYLTLLFVAFVVALTWGYRTSRAGTKGLGVRYYVVQTLLLLLMVPLCIAGMRGGFTTATRPITISNANQYVNHPIEAAVVLNTPFSIYRTLDKKVFVVPDYFSNRAEMERYFTPVHRPEAGTRFRPKNVVVFILESFGTEYFGAFNRDLKGPDYGYTPFLDSLITHSLVFERSFANGRKSIDGMPSVLSGIPMFVEPFFVTPASLNDVSSIGGELKKKDYYTAFFHGAENGSMGFQAYARTSGYTHYFGRTEYDNDKDYDGTWAIWDEPFFRFYAEEIGHMKEPFAVGLFSATSHHPFVIPEADKARFPEGTMPIHKCIRYTDNALRGFFDKAKRQPWYKNTLFVLVADHTNKGDTPEYMTDAGRFEVPIIFFCPGDPDLKGRRPGIAQQIDIMPTVLGYLGYDEPYVSFGVDLLRTPAEKTFAVNYFNGNYQYLKGDYFLQFDGKQTVGFYDYAADRLLQHNLAGTLPVQQQLEQELKSIIQQYMERMTGNRLVYGNETK